MVHAYCTKTRIAPTPSGYLHLGNGFSFLLTDALAKKAGGKILLRIDDLDSLRVREAYVNNIFDTLNFLEIHFDEGPHNIAEYKAQYSQLLRLPLYEKLLQRLMDEDLVYACSCSRTLASGSCECRKAGIPFTAPQTALKLKTGNEDILIKTLDRGNVFEKLPDSMVDFAVRKKDGFPSYQLASLVDDIHFNINLVVRGEDLRDSSLAQLYLSKKLGLSWEEEVSFHHHPLLKNAAGEKLSKSAGADAIRDSDADQILSLRQKIAAEISAVPGIL